VQNLALYAELTKKTDQIFAKFPEFVLNILAYLFTLCLIACVRKGAADALWGFYVIGYISVCVYLVGPVLSFGIIDNDSLMMFCSLKRIIQTCVVRSSVHLTFFTNCRAISRCLMPIKQQTVSSLPNSRNGINKQLLYVVMLFGSTARLSQPNKAGLASVHMYGLDVCPYTVFLWFGRFK